MKFTALTLAAIAFASTNTMGEASIRRVMTAQEQMQQDGALEMTLQFDTNRIAAHATPTAKAHRFMQSNTCSNTGNYCTPDASCVCDDGDYTVKENLRPDLASGCYHCSKPNGAQCADDNECLWGVSECNSAGVCATQQCPNDATVTVDPNTGWPLTTSTCTSQTCQCSDLPYTLKEDLGNGCFHCAKPDGALCSNDHECSSSSACNNNVCGPPQCSNHAVVSGSSTTSYCTRSSCECSGDYTVKQDITGDGCYHCSKPDGAACQDDHECQYGSSECANNICTAIVNTCPLLADNRCTFDATCVCEDPNPTKYTYTFQNGSKCYACTN